MITTIPSYIIKSVNKSIFNLLYGMVFFRGFKDCMFLDLGVLDRKHKRWWKLTGYRVHTSKMYTSFSLLSSNLNLVNG